MPTIEQSYRPFSNRLQSLSDWIHVHDDHATHHLELLNRAVHALENREAVSLEKRRLLAQKIERYRYQHLNEHGRSMAAEDETLVGLLDQMAHELAGRSSHLMRFQSRKFHGNDCNRESIENALGLLEPSVPLPRVVSQATALTQVHFAASDALHNSTTSPRRRMLLYAPLYVSNECINFCSYCGFRYPNKIAREHLNKDQILAQAQILRRRGFRHLVIVGGDFPSKTTPAYYEELITAIVELGIRPAIEIAAQSTEVYETLVDAGAWGLTLYQETYDEDRYAEYHTRGPKASFHWRLEAHQRAAEAGMKRLGLGVLLGLADPREDIEALMRHAAYLANHFADRTFALSLPRIHDAPGSFETRYHVSDEELIRYYCALRIAFPRAELVLSTRESVPLRNRLARICITQMSAGSCTSPGGYESAHPTAGEQFPVSDHRPPDEVVQWLSRNDFQVLSLPNLQWE